MKEAAFPSSDVLLETAREMFLLRKKVSEAREELGDETSPKKRKQAAALRRKVRVERARTRSWHRSFSMTGDRLELCRRSRRLRLNRMEREILAGLVLGKLALVDGLSCASCKDVTEFLDVSGKRALDALRCMSEKGRLFSAGLIAHGDRDDDLSQRTLVVDPVLLDEILFERRKSRSDAATVTQEEFYRRRLADLIVAYRNRARELDDLISGYGSASDHFKYSRQAERAHRSAEEILTLHPGWALSRCMRLSGLARNPHNRTIFLVLLGKEFSHLEADDNLFRGEGLALAVAGDYFEFLLRLKLLHPQGELVRRGFVQVCPGEEESEGDLELIRKTGFELGDRSLKLLGLERKRMRRDDLSWVRRPKMQMGRLVLSAKVRKSLEMAVAQARHAGVLTRKWGLGDTITYGRAVTILFSGPPGVGKTACAEAMAHELGKPILVIDYSQIQNCWVGKTEKNIVHAFRTARKHDAVLFWDEADAMFYNRDNSRQTFEVRAVNVLLQEVERFEGMCILATNRKVSLDPALERRISLRVEFERPDRRMRVEIWRRLLPERLPLGGDVDIEMLAGEELTGGEIKNVVLNAARLALVRGARGPVTMGDFVEALGMERASTWSGRKGRIGF